LHHHFKKKKNLGAMMRNSPSSQGSGFNFFHFLPWTNKLKMHSIGNFLKQVSWGSQGLAGFPKKLATSY
jgi:hypothetical protein